MSKSSVELQKYQSELGIICTDLYTRREGSNETSRRAYFRQSNSIALYVTCLVMTCIQGLSSTTASFLGLPAGKIYHEDQPRPGGKDGDPVCANDARQ